MSSTDPVTSPVPVVVIDARPVGGQDEHGLPLFVVDLTVLVADGDPWRSRLSVAVPDHGLRHLHPGAELTADLVATGGGFVPVLRFGDLVDRNPATPAPTANPSNARSIR